MKNSQKLISSLKSFEIRNQASVKGGIQGVVSWSDGKGYCDIRFPQKEVCYVPDGSVNVGDTYDTNSN